MNIINSKYLPIKITASIGKFTIALHWRWSITWRWLVRYKLIRTTWGLHSFKNLNGYSWRHINMGRLGQICVDVQPNMRRELEQEQ